MSVGAVSPTNIYAGVPGLAALGLGASSAPAPASTGTTGSTSTTPAAPAPSNPYSGVTGADALGLTAPKTTAPTTTVANTNNSVAGFTVLGIGGNGKELNAPPKSTGPDVYQQAYSGIITASNNYLQDTLVNGNPSTLPQYTAGSSAQQFALLSNTLAAISVGLHNGQFQGTGFNALA